jgi:hypothetical protein
MSRKTANNIKFAFNLPKGIAQSILLHISKVKSMLLLNTPRKLAKWDYLDLYFFIICFILLLCVIRFMPYNKILSCEN